MEEDTVMPDRGDTSYPEPEVADSNPYPALPANDSVLQPPAEATGFDNFADYYKLGERALFNIARLHQARRWENPTTGIVYDMPSGQSQASTGLVSAAPSISTARTLALPGFHFLPETDTFDSPGGQNDQNSSGSPIQGQEPSSAAPQSTRGPGRPRGSGRRGWKQALKGTDHAELFKTPRLTREAMGLRKGGRPKGIRNPQHADPGPEYKALQGKATVAFLDGDLETAKEHTLSALKINPEVWASYSLLYEITQKQGLELESIQVLASGAPVKRDPETWVEVASRLRSFKGPDITELEREFVLKCYEEAIKLDSRSFTARRARMDLYREMGSWNKARKECSTILQLQPKNLTILFEYAKLCHASGLSDDLRGATEVYERAFRLYAAEPSLGPAEEQWDHLNMYLEMLLKTGPPHTGVYQLKQVARWFLGRQPDIFWNEIYLQDDREFDDGPDRRIHVPQVQAGRVSQDASRYGLGLPIDIRVKLGVFRLQMGRSNHTEAFSHFEHLRQIIDEDDIYHLSDLFLEVGNNLRTRFMYGAAVEYYDRLLPVSDMLNREYWMNLAQCCREVGRNDDAEKYYRKVADADELEIHARINLIKLYEATSRTVKALPIADQLIQIGRSETLRSANLTTYLTACKRMRKKALKQAARRKPVTRPESDYDPQSDADPVDEEIEILPPTMPPPRRPKVFQRQRKLAAKPSSNDSGPSAEPAIITSPETQDQIAESSSDEEAEQEVGERIEETHNAEEDAEANGDGQVDSLREKPPKRGHAYLISLREQKERVLINYAKVNELWPSTENISDTATVHTWIQHAAAMAEEFKSMKEFFPLRSRDSLYTGLRTGVDVASRNLVIMAHAAKARLLQDSASLSRVDTAAAATSTADAEFHLLTFAEWHRVMSNLALIHARRSDQAQCFYILEHVLMPANVFRDDPVLGKATLAVGLCCALMFNDTKSALAFGKRMGLSQDLAMANQLLAACARLGHGENSFYRRKTYYWLAAALEEQDYVAMDAETRKNYDWEKDVQRLEEQARQFGEGQNDLKPGVLATYAHALGHSQHGNAHNITLPYLLRALAIEPENIVVNLTVAIAYVNQALRKASSDKQYDIAQGIAFLYRYYDLRVASGKASHIQEAEYNLARMWSRLEMSHLAMPAYEKVLGMSAEVRREVEAGECSNVEDYAQEAAVALQYMYAAAGNEMSAHKVSEEWLVL